MSALPGAGRRAATAVVCGLTWLIAVAFQSDPQALQRMVASERAFAAATAEIGVRDGFLTFFADDAVQIQRGATITIVPAREGLVAQSLAPLPLATRLIWEPFTGDVSMDGTMGWLTGGYVVMPQARQPPVRQGAYFSVWKRQQNGTWRVWLDEGVQLPRIWQDASPFRVAPAPDAGPAGSASETIADAERAVATDRTGWESRLAAGVRLHRDGLMPLVGRDAVLAWSANQTARYALMRSEAAESGDLAVTIGAMQASVSGTAPPGSWVRVWKRDVTGRWRIVFQTEHGG